MSNPLARRARIKDLSNKAEGIFQYVGNDNVLFRLISTGNKLTSDVNYSPKTARNACKWLNEGNPQKPSGKFNPEMRA